jgi:predicted GNAT family N-acyltransferase
MPIKLIDFNSPEYHSMVQLRLKILREPLGLHFTIEELNREKDDILIAAFEEENLLGCCILTKESANTLRLRQMAVTGSLQGKGIGAQMLRFAESVAKDFRNEYISMHARMDAVGFYKKQGYEVVSEVFTEVTLPHVVMQKKL